MNLHVEWIILAICGIAVIVCLIVGVIRYYLEGEAAQTRKEKRQLLKRRKGRGMRG